MRILSWNVNGIRAAQRKGFLDWIDAEPADIVCVQETKAHPEQLDDGLLNPDGYKSFWASSKVKKGYSGVAIFTKVEPRSIKYGLGVERFDQEGRTIIAEYDDFVLYNIYFPNGQMNEERLNFKLEFYDCFLEHVREKMKGNKTVIVCGDVNTAHYEIDLARPKANRKVSGFLPIECDWLDKFLDAGLLDTLRIFHPEPELYTWWSMRTKARERNVGWRIDYFYIDQTSKSRVKDAFIMPEIFGSDHCPIGLELK